MYKNLSEAIAGILLTMWGLVGNSMRTLYTLNNGKPDISRFMQIQVSGGRKNNAHGSSRDVYIAIVSLPLLRHKHCQYIGRIRILCDTSRKFLLNLEGKNGTYCRHVWNVVERRQCQGSVHITLPITDGVDAGVFHSNTVEHLDPWCS